MHCLYPLMKLFGRGGASPYEVQDCVRKDGMGGAAGGPNPKNLAIGLSNAFIEFPPDGPSPLALSFLSERSEILDDLRKCTEFT